MALLLYAVTLFVSAFILFLVQPMIGKMILPKLGGTPQVWNTCMVFFQMVLLAGYAYTHTVSTRLTLRQQLLIHCGLLFLPFLALLPNGPFNVEGWRPTLGANPFFETLLLLLIIVGLPFFVVSTSAPLLQKWFANTGHAAAKDPYFLYGASNLGSMLALLSYPFLVEWLFDLKDQAYIWTGLYGLLILMVLVCAAMVWAPASAASRLQLAPAGDAAVKDMAPASTAITAEAPSVPTATGIKKAPKPTPRGPGERPAADISLPHAGGDEMTTWRRVRWVLLAAVPVSLMLGVTTHITTDLSPIPLFWLVPLSLYLLSFILVFMRWPVPWVGEPHRIVLYAMPVLMALMIFVEMYALRDHNAIWASIFFDLLGFFATALVCHGELAKDRPSTRHLTEFFLLMSFGGMLGGMFNGLVAPLLFVYVWEFNLAVMAACLLRPAMRDSGWIDTFLAQNMGGSMAPARGGKSAPRPLSADTAVNNTKMLDFALPGAVSAVALVLGLAMSGGIRSGAFQFPLFFAYGLPLVLACLMLARPLRFGLAIAGIILVHSFDQWQHDKSEYSDRSYFGIIRVQKSDSPQPIGSGKSAVAAHYYRLIHGRIDHGMNFVKPDEEEWGNKDKDFSRLATTYYHRLGPAGRVMELYNWHSEGRANTYHADARMPGYILSTLAGDLNGGLGSVPSSLFVGLFSEPAYATVGLGTGTMASYGRPYQHVHYYEIDNHIRRLSLPVDEKNVYFTHDNIDAFAALRGRRKTYFTYLQDAIRRGAEVQVLMGDARLRMDLPYKNFHESPTDAGGPVNFYHMMVVDAFSSDAIPVHLITKQSIEMYFKKLKEDGILCVHTSNRYVNLPLVVGAVANDLGLAFMRGHDNAPASEDHRSTKVEEVGHYISDWVMIARKRENLPKDLWPKDKKTPFERLQRDMEPPLYRDQMRGKPDSEYWKPNSPSPDPRFIWTDDHSNLFQVLRWWLPKELQ